MSNLQHIAIRKIAKRGNKAHTTIFSDFAALKDRTVEIQVSNGVGDGDIHFDILSTEPTQKHNFAIVIPDEFILEAVKVIEERERKVLFVHNGRTITFSKNRHDDGDQYPYDLEREDGTVIIASATYDDAQAALDRLNDGDRSKQV